jgi:hypothetical protein
MCLCCVSLHFLIVYFFLHVKNKPHDKNCNYIRLFLEEKSAYVHTESKNLEEESAYQQLEGSGY